MAVPACVAKMKTAFAAETGRIAAMTEREIMTGDPDYFLQRIPEAVYDPSMGFNPRTVRVQTAPPIRAEYTSGLAPGGSRAVDYPDPSGDGSGIISGYANNLGGDICSIPAERVHWGYDEFGRCIRKTALETDPICLLEVWERKAVGATIQKLRDDLPRYGKEKFGDDLRRQVIKFAKTKYSFTNGLPHISNSPFFPAIPTGGLDIGGLRRIENDLRGNGWDKGSKTPVVNGRPALQVLASRDAIEFAIRSYKRQNNIVIEQNMITAEDPTFGMTEIRNGIQFIEDRRPTRGYLTQQSPGQYIFNEVQPYVVRAGVEGVVPDHNPDYDAGFITVGGVTYPMMEIGFIVHPRAMERQAVGAIPKVDGKPASKMFNFEVNLVPDWAIAADPRCNKDQVYVQYRITHAYAPLPYNPELMTAFIYLAATPQYAPINPNAEETLAASNPIGIAPFAAPRIGGCTPCADETVLRNPVVPTCTDVAPANGVGLIRFAVLSYDVNEAAGGVTVVVERVNGSVGAASVNYATANGSATQPTNYTTTTGTLNWADGAIGKKSFVVPINTHVGDDDGKQFTVVLSGVTGSTLSGNTTATVTILDPDEAA